MAEIKVYTTPPYPILSVDHVNTVGISIDGIVWSVPIDEIDAIAVALNGEHRILLHEYFIPPDEVTAAVTALDGIHRMLLHQYSIPPEYIDATPVALNGIKRVVLIQYLNYAPEEIDIEIAALNGTHTSI